MPLSAKMEEKLTTGEIVKGRREALGLSMRELARRADVSHTQISRIEADESAPTLPLAGRIADALGVSIDELAARPSAEAVA